MNWLEEAIIDISEHGDKPYVLIRKTTADRLIAIAERAEWEGMGNHFYPACPICNAEPKQLETHKPTCPYSDEYKP